MCLKRNFAIAVKKKKEKELNTNTEIFQQKKKKIPKAILGITL